MNASDITIARREMLTLAAGVAAMAASPPAFGKSHRIPHFDWRLHKPEAVGMSRSGLEGVRDTIQRHIDNKDLTGAVTAIARHNELIWYEAQGVSNVETGAPMRKDGIFRMMSSSKPLTAACILMLMDQGKLSIDDKVSRFLPTFRNPKVAQLPPGSELLLFDPAKRDKLKSEAKIVPADREITLKDLLTHTAGLGTFLGVAGGIAVPLVPSETLAERIPQLGSVPLDFQPGSRWAYSPLDGFDVLLRVVEIVSGMPADEFMRTRLFRPLDMADTGFHLTPEQRQRLVPAYSRQGDSWKAQPGILGDGAASLKYLSGSGGILSTAHDYMQFQEMLLNRGQLNGRRLLKPGTVAMMSTNQVGPMFAQFPLFGRKGWGFGLGVAIVLDPEASGSGRGRGSFGWDGALGTDAWVDPEHDLAAVYFVQQPVKAALADFGKAIAKAIVA